MPDHFKNVVVYDGHMAWCVKPENAARKFNNPAPILLRRQVVTFLPQPLRLTYLQAAVLRLPGVDRVLAHPHLAGYVFSPSPGFHLLQRRDHLRFAVLAFRHAPSLSRIRNHTCSCADLGEQVNCTCTSRT